MFSECCQNPRTNERCHVHKKHMLTLFCSNKQCLQPLCSLCLKEHKKIHVGLNWGEPKIVDMKNLEDHSEKSIDKQLKIIEECRDKDHKPEQTLYKEIDKFLYGTMEKRESLLKEQKKQIRNEFNAHLLVRMIEQGHTYELTENFEMKYFKFLDKLIDAVSKRHEKKEKSRCD